MKGEPMTPEDEARLHRLYARVFKQDDIKILTSLNGAAIQARIYSKQPASQVIHVDFKTKTIKGIT